MGLTVGLEVAVRYVYVTVNGQFSLASYSNCVHFCQVRLPLLPICFLMGVVAKEEIVKQNLKCRDLLDEARNYHLHLSSRAVPDFEYSIRTTPRKQTAGN